MRWPALICLFLVSACGLKNLATANCAKPVIRAAVSLSPDSCRSQVRCDVRVFDPAGPDSGGAGASETTTLGDRSIALNVFHFNTASAAADAEDPSEYDRTEVACYVPGSDIRAEADELAKAVAAVDTKCQSKE